MLHSYPKYKENVVNMQVDTETIEKNGHLF